MSKKSKILIVLIIIIIIIFAIFCYFNPVHNFNNSIKVGNAIFDLPDGYRENKTGKDDLFMITNGTENICIEEYNDTNITNHVNAYKNYKLNNQSHVSKIVNYTVDGTQIYKLTDLNESTNNHYWFVHNKNTYSIYSWTKNPQIDSIVIKLISTVH